MDQVSGGNNVINNYKGVMLCSRPNQAPISTNQKPFCGRVVPRSQLGLVPVKQQSAIGYEIKKPRLQILDRHKKWLQNFKKDVQEKKNQIQQNKVQQEQRMLRIKQQAEQDRQRSKKMKHQYNETANNVLSILDDSHLPQINNNQLTPQNLNRLNRVNDSNNDTEPNHKEQNSKQRQIKQQNNPKPNDNFKKNKKTAKPLWAQTQQEVQVSQQNQVDQLLDFFSTNHVEDYANNQQVKQILSKLKGKIQTLREEQDWKQKEMNKINRIKQEKKRQQQNQNDEDDKYTHFSGQSEGRSVASEKTQQKLQKLRLKKKQQQDWDKNTISQKSSIAGIDEKIAKNIADQVLRNYPNMRGVHSNVSIRKLLEAEAAKVMNEPIYRPVITTVIRQKQKIDANNLPYLHRNPAI